MRCFGGFGFFEILLSTVLLSVAALSLIKTHYISRLSEWQNAQTIQLQYLFIDMLDTLCLNKNASYYATGYHDPASISTDCQQRSCGARELAKYQVSFWKCRLGKQTGDGCTTIFDNLTPLFPDGKLRISLSRDHLQLTAQWSDAEGTLQNTYASCNLR